MDISQVVSKMRSKMNFSWGLSPQSLFYTHDGNKNVSEVVHFSRANGVAAHYEYAPFGEITAQVRQGGIAAYDFAALNPWRFSSEYSDDASATVYYNYRHYEPIMGRWMNRDAKEQLADFIFVQNNGLNLTDILGMESSEHSDGQIPQKRACTYLIYAAHGTSDPDGNLWGRIQSLKFPKCPNGDRYGYWGCGANVFYEMTKNEHPGFELPVSLPEGTVEDDEKRIQDLINEGIPEEYARRYEKIGGDPNPTLSKTVDELKSFARISEDLSCHCSSVTIKVECLKKVKDAELIGRLSQNELRAFLYLSPEGKQKLFEKYRGKLKCDTSITIQ